MKLLILIRGLPGSGKSTLAEQISENGYNGNYARYENDDYFTNEKGEYKWNALAYKSAVQYTKSRTERGMDTGIPTIIVSNCFLNLKSMLPYRQLAEKYNYKVQTITCQGDFGNIHNVPDFTVECMRKLFQP